MSANRLFTALCVPWSAMALFGCLAGERAPITTLYPDPLSQAPVVSGQSPMVSGSATRVERFEFYGAPGTTLHYEEIPTQPVYPYAYGYGPYTDPQGHLYGLRPGQQRYTFLGRDVRCDNLDRSCARWSGKRGAFVPDHAATQQFYGGIPSRPYDGRRRR